MSQPYRVARDASLRERNTFGIDATAAMLVEVFDPACLPEVFSPAIAGRDAMVLGGGSNVLFADDPAQPLVALAGRRMQVLGERDGAVHVRAEAGVAWHPFVLWTLEQGLGGLENLALIPGTVGAAPIQNIGAYGVEVGDTIHAVETYDRATGDFVRLDNAACAFAYRDSVFKRAQDRYVVTGVEFALPRTPALRTAYAGIGEELAAMGVDVPTPRAVADAVTRLRRRKLPDPVRTGNAGSFFKNPIVPETQATMLGLEYPRMPAYPGGDDTLRKLSAAWLIEQCGWKGHREGDAGVSALHALVLVNHGNASGAQLLDLARRVAGSVQSRFGVAIEPEPRIVGATW